MISSNHISWMQDTGFGFPVSSFPFKNRVEVGVEINETKANPDSDPGPDPENCTAIQP